ncbi:MAG TPA: HEAT repeat domain-containing protein [Gemmataceae bacterium]|nr:HEAT repeat domain-containing protein [Gemmataceae bacterium]
MRHWNRTYLGVGAVAVLLLAGAGLWWGRQPLLTWYYLRGLSSADGGERDRWAERVAGLDRAALPALLDLLAGDDRACAGARAALDALIGRWGADDARGEELARRLSEAFARFSPAGRREVLQFEAGWLRTEGRAPPTDVARALARQLPEAAKADDGAARGAALDLAAALMERPDYAEAVGPCRELALACFGDADADNRGRALQLALHPGMDLQQQALPLLRDPTPEVRRLAMLAVGPAQNVISTDELLHWLHDPDPDVRRLCEVALSSRKVPLEHIRLGRTLTDPDYHVRLNVLDELHNESARDIDASIWLRYLSHDPKESVRVAAVRAAVEHRFSTPVDLRDRLEQMARTDPSETVRQEAGHYLSRLSAER